MQQAGSRSPDRRAIAVDVHAPMVPGGLLESVRAGDFPGLAVDDASGGPVLTAGGDRLGPVVPDMTDLGGRLRWMDERSIAEQWVSPWLDLFTWHRFGEADGRRWAAPGSEALAHAPPGSGGRRPPGPLP